MHVLHHPRVAVPLLVVAVLGVSWPALSPGDAPRRGSMPQVVLGPSEALSTPPPVHVAPVPPSSTANGSQARPYSSIQTAVDRAPEGSTVVVAAGTYKGFRVTRDRITVTAATGARVVVREAGRTNVVQFKEVVGGGINGLDIVGSTVSRGSGVKVGDSSGVRIRNSKVHDSLTFGIVVSRSTDVLIERNEVYNNASGIEEWYAARLTIRANRVHHNLKPVDSGRGAEGMNFYKSTGAVLIESNTMWDNRTHFEVYGASNLTFRYNRTRNGQVMETGTDGTLPCARIHFTRNVTYKGTTASNGMILRCAKDGLVTHNVFDGFDQFAIDITDGTQNVAYGGSIEGLRVYNNAIVGGRAFSIDNKLPASVRIDYNIIDNTGSTAKYGNYLAYVAGRGNAKTISELRAWTGYMVHGLKADPRFVSRAKRDYRLLSTSPAIDRGVPVGQSWLGRAPDLGRVETR